MNKKLGLKEKRVFSKSKNCVVCRMEIYCSKIEIHINQVMFICRMKMSKSIMKLNLFFVFNSQKSI